MSDNTPPPGPPHPPSSGGAPPPPPGGGAPGSTRPGELLDRFLARLLDFILLAIVNGIVTGLLIVGLLGLNSSTLGFGGNYAASAISAVLTVAIGLGYFAYMESAQGRTLGKMVLKLRVQGPSGGNPTFEEAIKRNIWMALPILGIIPFLGILGGLAQLAAVIMIAIGINNDPERRRPWTDKFADTQVLKVT